MPANFRKSGRKFISENGLIKYQDTGEFNDQWIKDRLSTIRSDREVQLRWLRDRQSNSLFKTSHDGSFQGEGLQMGKKGGSCKGGCSTGPNRIL